MIAINTLTFLSHFQYRRCRFPDARPLCCVGFSFLVLFVRAKLLRDGGRPNPLPLFLHSGFTGLPHTLSLRARPCPTRSRPIRARAGPRSRCASVTCNHAAGRTALCRLVRRATPSRARFAAAAGRSAAGTARGKRLCRRGDTCTAV